MTTQATSGNGNGRPRRVCLVVFLVIAGLSSGIFMWALGAQEGRIQKVETKLSDTTATYERQLGEATEDRKNINKTLVRIEKKLDDLIKQGGAR